MSDHTDTIRRALQEFDDEVPQGDATLATDALAALDALVAENQRLRDALTLAEDYIPCERFPEYLKHKQATP